MNKDGGRLRIYSKWKRMLPLFEDRQTRRYVPETVQYSRKRLQEMLVRHGVVYLKPDLGAHGRDVCRLERISAGKRTAYTLRAGEDVRRFSRFDVLAGAVGAIAGREPYLLQRGVQLLRIRDRLFDFRVMVQRNERGKWEVTGIAGRLAKPGRIVTNGSQGADIRYARELFRAAAPGKPAEQHVRRLTELGLAGAAAITRVYPESRELGFDIAADDRLRLWILEVNTRPEATPFTKLPNRSMYKRIGELRRYNRSSQSPNPRPASGDRRKLQPEKPPRSNLRQRPAKPGAPASTPPPARGTARNKMHRRA